MWGLWGLLSFGVVVAYLANRRYAHNWSGKSFPHLGPDARARVNQIRFSWAHLHVRHIDVSIRGVPGLHFSVKPRGGWDYLFERLGLISECKTRIPHFDDSYFVLSDNPDTCQLLAENPEIVTLMSHFIRHTSPNGMTLRAIHVNRHKVSIRLQPHSNDRTPNLAQNTAVFAPLLVELRDALVKAHARIGNRPLRDTLALKSAILLGISSALLLFGIGLLFYEGYLGFWKTGDVDQFSRIAFSVGASVALTLILMAFLTLFKTSRFHLVLLELVLIGAPGALLTANQAWRVWNHDPGMTPVVHQIPVTHTAMAESARGELSHYLYFDDWRNPQQIYRIQVTEPLYQAISNETEAVVINIREYPGRLGVSWIPARFDDPNMIRLTRETRPNETITQSR